MNQNWICNSGKFQKFFIKTSRLLSAAHPDKIFSSLLLIKHSVVSMLSGVDSVYRSYKKKKIVCRGWVTIYYVIRRDMRYNRIRIRIVWQDITLPLSLHDKRGRLAAEGLVIITQLLVVDCWSCVTMYLLCFPLSFSSFVHKATRTFLRHDW